MIPNTTTTAMAIGMIDFQNERANRTRPVSSGISGSPLSIIDSGLAVTHQLTRKWTLSPSATNFEAPLGRNVWRNEGIEDLKWCSRRLNELCAIVMVPL